MRIKSLAIDFHFSVCNDSMLYGFRLRFYVLTINDEVRANY